MTRVAFLFPGQGSQQVGMGRDLAGALPASRELFDAAGEFTSSNILRTCARGPMPRLSRTDVLQPALTAVSLSCALYLRDRGIEPAAAAGHSVGELGALAAAGTVTAVDALRAAAARGRAMHEASVANPGAMVAVGGLDAAAAADALDDVLPAAQGGIAAVNAPDQIVVSCTTAAMPAVRRTLTERGARVTPLNVSGAWHCALMEPARGEYARTLDAIEIRPPTLPVPMNATGATCDDPALLRRQLADQLVRPVRWVDTVQALILAGVDVYVELGPGTVLRGLLRRIHPDHGAYRVYSAGDVRTLDRVVGELGD